VSADTSANASVQSATSVVDARSPRPAVAPPAVPIRIPSVTFTVRVRLEPVLLR
jgi:hypothetical protein